MKKNILVVDDSALMRRMFCDIINSDERFHVLNKAIDGEEALELLRMYDYDAVVLDVNMPRMDGLELLREMQKYQIKTRVMMASSDTREGTKITMDALELGALDFIHKPNNVSDCKDGSFKEDFLRTLAAVSGSRMPTIGKAVMERSQRTSRMVADIARKGPGKVPEKAIEKAPEKAPDKPLEKTPLSSKPLPKDPFKKKPDGSALNALKEKVKKGETGEASDGAAPFEGKHSSIPGGNKLVAIASSTGGPKALQPVLTSLPKDLSCPVVLVQHMPMGFTKSLAERLNAICELEVKEAKEGEILKPGCVYIAMGGKHMHVDMRGTSYAIRYSDEPSREGVKPCANYMYESLRASAFDEIVCVVMTGMGADGTEGILNLKKTKRVHVIVQEKSTCAVYGMPKSVVSAGLADQILPLDRIAQEIIMCVGVK